MVKYNGNLLLKRDRKLFKKLLIFRVIAIFEKSRNLMFFALYFYETNILPLTCAHQMQNSINLYATMEKRCQFIIKIIRHFKVIDPRKLDLRQK